MLLIAAALAQAAPPAAPDPRLARMVALYDELCLKAFPDDAAMDRIMAARGAVALTSDQVKVTLRDDPGHGWMLDDGDQRLVVMVEMPPFHACSVRRQMGEAAVDLAPYRAVADVYAAAHGLSVERTRDGDKAGLHIHAAQTARVLPGGGAESLMVFEQTVIDPARRAAGETGMELRLVHQLVAAPR